MMDKLSGRPITPLLPMAPKLREAWHGCQRLWLLVCLVTLSCTSHARDASPLTPITLQLRWHHQFQFAGYYAAQQQGYYQAAGLDVTIIAGAPGLEPVKEVLQGNAHYGVANSELLHQRLKGQPLVALAAIFQHSASIFMARQDSGIQTPQDLVNRKVMMISKGADVGLMAMLHNEGVDLSQIEIIKSSYNIESLINGEVDAFNSYLTNEPYFMAQHDIPITILRPSTYGVDFYSDILFTTEQELEQHPDRVKQFRAASLQGWKYAMEHPAEIVELILAHYNQQKKSREHLLYEAESMRRLIMPEVVEYGHMNPGRWKHMADVLVSEGMANPNYSLSGFIYDDRPKPDNTRWHLIITVLGIAMVVFCVIAATLYYYNLKLKNAISFGLRVQRQLQDQTAKFEAIFRSIPDATVICTPQGEINLCNPAFCKTFGYTPDQAIGHSLRLLYPDEKSFLQHKEKQLSFKSFARLNDCEITFKRSNDQLFPSQTISGPILGNDGEAIGCIVVIRDITHQKQSQQEIVRMALTDPLTGLANRHQFNRRVEELIHLAKRQRQLLSLALMDLDYFKQVNDKFGHPVGDKLLIEIANILKTTFRETDTIARIGGDEFAILMLNPSDHVAICQPAMRLIEALNQAIVIDEHEVSIGVSFGIATYPLDSDSAEELYRLADRALYLSKESGRNRCSLACEQEAS